MRGRKRDASEEVPAKRGVPKAVVRGQKRDALQGGAVETSAEASQRGAPAQMTPAVETVAEGSSQQKRHSHPLPEENPSLPEDPDQDPAPDDQAQQTEHQG